MQENILEDSQEEKSKTSLITKIITGAVLTGALLVACGCDYMVSYSRGPRIRTHTRNPILRYNYPPHMRGTLMDPFPPGRRGYQSPRRISPYRISPRRPFGNSPYRQPPQRDRKSTPQQRSSRSPSRNRSRR